MEKKNFLEEFSQLKVKLEAFFSVPRNRLLGAVVFAILILLIVFGLTSTDTTQNTVVDVKQPTSGNLVTSNIPNDKDLKKSDKNVVRNPFAIPSAYHKEERINGAVGATNVQGGGSMAKAVEPARPKLTGIIGGDGKTFAIIEYNGESRKCQVGEGIGPYQVTDIGYNNASLAGPEDSILLRVGR